MQSSLLDRSLFRLSMVALYCFATSLTAESAYLLAFDSLVDFELTDTERSDMSSPSRLFLDGIAGGGALSFLVNQESAMETESFSVAIAR